MIDESLLQSFVGEVFGGEVKRRVPMGGDFRVVQCQKLSEVKKKVFRLQNGYKHQNILIDVPNKFLGFF